MEKGGAEFYTCFTLYIVINVTTKKNSKKQRAGTLLASAVKWAEIAADPENGQAFVVRGPPQSPIHACEMHLKRQLHMPPMRPIVRSC